MPIGYWLKEICSVSINAIKSWLVPTQIGPTCELTSGQKLTYNQVMDWSLRTCARKGHVTYRPDEEDWATGLWAQTPVGVAWKCLRCAAFIPGEAFEHGPASKAPTVLHDRQIRDQIIIRALSIERGIRGLIVIGLAFLTWQLRGSQDSLEERIASDLPLLKPFADQIGWNIQESRVIHVLNQVVEASSKTLLLITLALLAYGTLQLIEAVGLWLTKRWAEYLTVVATSAFIPVEVYELSHSITFIKLGALVINILAVLWLVWSKHLFGFNGGLASAHDEKLSGESAISYAKLMTSEYEIVGKG
jgi:uncharacterized membrane protein (DUF2068 family)